MTLLLCGFKSHQHLAAGRLRLGREKTVKKMNITSSTFHWPELRFLGPQTRSVAMCSGTRGISSCQLKIPDCQEPFKSPWAFRLQVLDLLWGFEPALLSQGFCLPTCMGRDGISTR
jgi:hypothetical protein